MFAEKLMEEAKVIMGEWQLWRLREVAAASAEWTGPGHL